MVVDLKNNIVVSLQVEGVHRWLNCPIEEVSFLKDYHRHLFFIKCKKEVSHLDRDIEIIKLKRDIEKFLKVNYASSNDLPNTCLFGDMSCEMIANKLMQQFNLNYCSVLEDNENGAEVELC